MKDPKDRSQDELSALCYGWCDGLLSDEEIRRLDALLESDEEAQRYFARATSLNAALEALGPVQTPSNVVAAPRRTWPWRAALEIAAVLTTLAALTWVFLTVPPPDQFVAESATPPDVGEQPNFAVISHTIGATWAKGTQPLRAGAALSAGEINLESGILYLQYYNGVKLVLEGPVEMEVVSLEEANCYRGKFHANVPPHAQGFVINTPIGQLVDHGTEFGLEVDEDGSSEIHVFSGEVFFQSTLEEGDVTRLRKDEAARIDPLGRKVSLFAENGRFTSDREVKQEYSFEMERQFNTWYLSSMRWRKDPGVLAYYDFDQLDYLSDVIPADTSDPYVAGQEGVVIGARNVEGRWPGKSGFAFQRGSDRIRVRIPGYHDELTFAAWVRIDRLENRTHSLMMSDGFDHGAVHWQFHGGTGQLLLTTRRESEEFASYASPPVIDQRMVGQWQHIACVYDRLGGEVRHYLNGQEVSKEPLKLDVRLRMGVGEIGNWGLPRQGQHTDHHFLGVMDEFVVFGRKLEPEELELMVAQGEPG